MTDKDYKISLNTKAKPGHVFNAINKIDKWWTEDLEGNALDLNQVFTVHFGDTWKTFKVVEFVPEHKVNWEVVDCFLPWNANKTEWIGTNVIFEIQKKNDCTEIVFTHIGLKESADCFASCSNAWSAYLQNSLSHFITTGKGKPNEKRK